jgi:23S rRNA G2445 N2-methylase RlmL
MTKRDPFKYFQSSPEIIRLAVMMYIRFLQQVVGPNTRVDAAFLDPPYNVRINGHANAKGRHREFAMASGEMSATEFRSFLSATLGAWAACVLCRSEVKEPTPTGPQLRTGRHSLLL